MSGDATSSGTPVDAGPDNPRCSREAEMSSSAGASQTAQSHGADVQEQAYGSNDTTGGCVKQCPEQGTVGLHGRGHGSSLPSGVGAGDTSVQYLQQGAVHGREPSSSLPSGVGTGDMSSQSEKQGVVLGKGHDSSDPLSGNTSCQHEHHTDKKPVAEKENSSILSPNPTITLSASTVTGTNTSVVNTQPQFVSMSHLCMDILLQELNNLDINDTGHHTAHQSDDHDQQASQTKEEHVVSSDSHALPAQMEGDVNGKQNILPQSNESSAVGSVKKEDGLLESVPNSGTQRAKSNNSETESDKEQDMAKQNSGETQQDHQGKISLHFAAYIKATNSVKTKMFPEKISFAKWILIRKCGKLKDLVKNKECEVSYDHTGGRTTLTSLNSSMRVHEADEWMRKCRHMISEMLLEIESVTFVGADISRLESCIQNVLNRKLHYTVDSKRKQLEVFSCVPEEMDKFLAIAVPLVRGSDGVKMLIKIVYPPERLHMLDCLGFKKHCETVMAGVKAWVNFEDNEYIFDCCTDLRRRVHVEIKHFLDSQEYIFLNFDEMYMKFLFDAMDDILIDMKNGDVHCWWRENQGSVVLMSPTREMLVRAKDIIEQGVIDDVFQPQTETDMKYFMSKLHSHPLHHKQFCFQQTANGYGIRIISLRHAVDALQRDIPEMFNCWAAVGIGNKDSLLPQKERSGSTDTQTQGEERTHSTDSQQTKQERAGSTDTQTQGEERTHSTDSQQTKQERAGSTDTQTQGEERTHSTDSQQTKQERAGSTDTQTQGKERTHSTDSQQTKQERAGSTDTQTQGEERTHSTDSQQTKQERAGNTPSSLAQEGFGGPPPTAQLSGQASSGVQRENEGREESMQTENSRSDGVHNHVRFKIPDVVLPLLQVHTVLDKFKSLLMDKSCLIRCDSISEGFIVIMEGGREKDVLSTLDELFCCYSVEAGEDDPDMKKEVKSLWDKFPDKIFYTCAQSMWNICVTADIKDEIHDQLEELKKSHCFVPLPLYACDFIALKNEIISSEMQKSVHASVSICISDIDDKNQGAKVSAYRGFLRQAVWWLHWYVLSLEATEKAVDVDSALCFQDLHGQEWFHETEKKLTCRIDTIVDKDISGLYATAPSGQRLVVCGDSLAATECDCIVLPIWDGQKEWPFFQQQILSRSLLSDCLAAYQRRCQDGPVKLRCNADYDGKTLILVLVPAEWNSGSSKEKQRIIDAYQAAFAICGEDQRSVAVCARQSSKLVFRKSLKALLWAIFGTLSASSTACNTVVIYTDTHQDRRVVCQAVRDGAPEGWFVRPQRVPRSRSGNGTIKVCVGEVQNTQADIVVNTTHPSLVPQGGAVENAIAKAAGMEMRKECMTKYPGGIVTNGLAVTDSHNMRNAKKIYHIALSLQSFKEGNSRVLLHDLGQVVLHCLLQASLDGHDSIAFPTLGSGKLHYPCEDVARVMFSTINYFFREMPHTSLHTVIIVVYWQNSEAIQALKMEEISQLYGLPSEEDVMPQIFETRKSLNGHKIQILQGNTVSKPWVSDVCVHGELASDKRDDGGSQTYRSVVVKSQKPTENEYKNRLKQAFKLGKTVQIAAHTLPVATTLKDLASAVENVLLHEKDPRLLILTFSEEETAASFPKCFKDLTDWNFKMDKEREDGGLISVCSFHGGYDMHRVVDTQAPSKYKEMLKLYRTAVADHTQSQTEARREDKEHDLCTISVPSQILPKAAAEKILDDTGVKEESNMTHISVKFKNLMTVATSLCENVGNRAMDTQAEESKETPPPDPESTSTWSKDLDEFEIRALRFLLGKNFDQSFEVKESDEVFTVTLKGGSSATLQNQVEMLRREVVQLTTKEVSALGDTVDVRSEGVEAFVKVMPTRDRATVFALDYGAMSKAKHLVTIKAGRVKVTSRGRRRFDAGTSGQQEQTSPQPLHLLPHSTGSDVTTRMDFVTKSGIRVSVYKVDITKLPVDAIVNAANEHLAHGGGVAAAIAKAAGFALEREGREHIKNHGELKVRDVVETTGGLLPCQKVLHAVGPCWGRYTDKTLCKDHLVSTVLNCLLTANASSFRSLALPSISAAIFGVPQQVCAESYLSAVKKFDDSHGTTTSLKDVHFVDVNDSMISIIQSTFSAQLKSSSSTSGNHNVQSTTASAQLAEGSAGRQEESAGPVQSLTKEREKLLDMQPQSQSSPADAVHDQSPRNEAQLVPDPLGSPVFRMIKTKEDCQAQIEFKGLNLIMVFQNRSASPSVTESVVLWQELGKDIDLKPFQNVQLLKKISEMKKDKAGEGKIVTDIYMDKLLVFPFLSPHISYSKEKMRGFVEQILNKIDLEQKKTVSITRRQKAGKVYNTDLENFVAGLFMAVKNYAMRASRSITEIHVLETDPDALKSMIDIVQDNVAVERSLLDRGKSQPAAATASHSSNLCVVCASKPKDPVTQNCGHIVCRHCIGKWLQAEQTCPMCSRIKGTGDQPEDGRMEMMHSFTHMCAGFQWGSYIIQYLFPPGTQMEKHLYPAKRYSGTEIKAYLPDTHEGRKVLMLLKMAFDRRLVFTMSQSGTEGIIPNIHHKTQLFGPPGNSVSYPDPKYLSRVQRELASMGVTENDLTAIQRDFIKNPVPYRSFFDFSARFSTKETPL